MGAPLLLFALTLLPVAAAASLEPWDSLLLILGGLGKGLSLRGGAEGLHSLAPQSWMVGAWLPGGWAEAAPAESWASSTAVLACAGAALHTPQSYRGHRSSASVCAVLVDWNLVWGWKPNASATECLASLVSSHSLALCTHNWSIVDWAAVSWLVAGWWHRETGSSPYWAYSSFLVWKGA